MNQTQTWTQNIGNLTGIFSPELSTEECESPWKLLSAVFKIRTLLLISGNEIKDLYSAEHRRCTPWGGHVRQNQILPGGKILSLSRMRADARSLIMYWRRTYLNTEQKDAPSSVFKKGSFSHRSVDQGRTKKTVKHPSVTINKRQKKIWCEDTIS